MEAYTYTLSDSDGDKYNWDPDESCLQSTDKSKYADICVDKDNKPHGRGTKIYENGTTFTGNFVHGKIDGAGTYKYKDGSYITGTFKNSKWNYNSGFNIKYSNGDKYRGKMIYK